MQTLTDDVNCLVKSYIQAIDDEIALSQRKLSDVVSEMLFDTINGISNEKNTDIPTQQRIAYFAGKIDTLKNLMEDLNKNAHLRTKQRNSNEI
jgi:methionyl-tRNA formyltransferase